MTTDLISPPNTSDSGYLEAIKDATESMVTVADSIAFSTDGTRVAAEATATSTSATASSAADINATVGFILTTLASIISGAAAFHTVLDAGSQAIGKLSANASGVLVGMLEIAAGQSVKLAANTSGVLAGMVEIAANQSVKLAANASGVLVGMVEVAPPSAPVAGQKTVAAVGTAEALGSGALKQGVTVRTLTTNSFGVELRTAAGTPGYQLGLGESLFCPCSDLGQWFIKVGANGEGVSFLAG